MNKYTFLFFESVNSLLWYGRAGRRGIQLLHSLYEFHRKMLLLIWRSFCKVVFHWWLFCCFARSACSLAVTSTDNSSFAKWLKALGTPYIPEKEQCLSQVPLVLRTHFGEYLCNLSNFSCMSAALQHGKNFLVARAKNNISILLHRHYDTNTH